MPIHIRGEDEETLAKLKELGFDVHVVTEDPMADLLFYLSRINSKLDNLGQIRHLHKIMQSVLKMKSAAEIQQLHYGRLNAEAEMRAGRLRKLYTRLADLTDLPQNDMWRKGVIPFHANLMTSEKDVLTAFNMKTDENYYLYAMQDNFVFVKDVDGGALPLGIDKNGSSIRLINL